jgi:hypothetical protein
MPKPLDPPVGALTPNAAMLDICANGAARWQRYSAGALVPASTEAPEQPMIDP